MVYILLFLSQLIVLFLLSRRIHNGIFRTFYKLTRSQKASVYLMAILFLPGTFLHEASHFLTALFLLVPASSLEIIPKIEEGGVKLGSVGLAKTDPLRRFAIGVAPFFVGTLTILLGVHFLVKHNLLREWTVVALSIYLIFSISNTMFMSRKDLEGAWKAILILFILMLILYVVGLDIVRLGFDISFSGRFLQILKTTNLFMLIPVGINLLLSYVLRK